MAIPKVGFFEGKEEQGRYGPIFPKTPACHGFTIIAKIKPGREEAIREYGKKLEETVAGLPDALDVLKLHTLKWVLFDIKGETYFMYQGIFDTDFDKYTEDAVSIFSMTGLDTVFETLQGFPKAATSIPHAFIRFVRVHYFPSFLKCAEYACVSPPDISSAGPVKSGLASVFDNMQL